MKITQENINNCDSNIFGEWINNEKIINELSIKFNNVEPFEHIILPNFLNGEIADKISEEYPSDLNTYHKYNNPLEIKYAYDDISNMSENLQNVFYALCSVKLLNVFKKIIAKEKATSLT